ncbi:MAG: LacI family transcriptional regulator [Lachnospiraceae bacterium]|nr:LacI family transcriptional regulator [Lachnospiraceae bacterium]
MNTVKIADIAKAAGVSPSTVTRVIRNDKYVSDEKRKLVQQALEKFSYVPNRVASGLRSKQTNLIGHILPVSSENPFFARIGNAFNKAAEDAGYNVLTAVTQMNPHKERAMVENFVSLMVDAIVITTMTAIDDDTINMVCSRGIPVVMIERPCSLPFVDAILFDNHQASSLAIHHFIKNGHKDIGFIGREPQKREVENQRLNGYIDVMQQNDLPVRKEWTILTDDYTVNDGRLAMERILSAPTLPSALLVTSDVLACGILQILHEHDLSVPEDISLIGFDNTLSALSTPPLTTIDLQPEQIGTTALEMISEQKDGKRKGSKSVILSPVLIERSSVKNLERSYLS